MAPMKPNPLPNKLSVAAALFLAVLLTGCFDTKQEYTINPDGSGKVVHECTFQHMSLNMGGADTDPQEALRDAIRDVLKNAKGVDAWRDVTFKQMDNQRMYFRGTAYFKDLSKLEIPNQAMLDFAWQSAPGGKMILSLRTNKESDEDGLAVKPQPAPAAKLTPEEQAKKLADARASYQQSKPMLAAILGSAKQESLFHLPGKVSASTNFEAQPAGALKIAFSGAKFLEMMDKLQSDDAWMLKNAASGAASLDEKPPMDDQLNGMLFGTKGPVEAVVTGASAPLFNYAAEVAAAKLDFAKTEKELGLSAASIAPPAAGEPLKNLRVAGVRLITESDSKQDLRPFQYPVGYSVALCADFAGSVLAVTDKSRVETAIADDGTSLLPEGMSGRNIQFPRLSKDKSAAVFEISLKVPGKGVSGLKELSGHLQYTIAGGTKQVDLGIDGLKKGATGTEDGAQIMSIQEGWQKNGSQEMQLKLNLSVDSVKSVTLVEGEKKTELERNGYFGGGNSCTLTFSSKTAFPAQARLTAELYDQIQTFDVPFKIENITLLWPPRRKIASSPSPPHPCGGEGRGEEVPNLGSTPS